MLPTALVIEKMRKTVSTVAGSTSIQLLRAARKNGAMEVTEVAGKDTSDGFLLLSTGRADAYVLDDVQLAGMIASAPNPADLAVVGEPIQVEPYAIMLRKDDPAFKKLVDDTLVTLIQSGQFEMLYKKWFQSPIPPRGINLNAPMSKELQDNLKALSDKPAL